MTGTAAAPAASCRNWRREPFISPPSSAALRLQYAVWQPMLFRDWDVWKVTMAAFGTKQPVGWVERSETQRMALSSLLGFAFGSTQDTGWSPAPQSDPRPAR